VSFEPLLILIDSSNYLYYHINIVNKVSRGKGINK
jgi:hypothetical protein